MLKRTVVTSVCSFLLLSAIAFGQQSEPEASSYVLYFLDEKGETWGSEGYPTRAAADTALENYRQAYSELRWGKLNAEVRQESDILGGKAVKSRANVTEPFKLRLAKRRESQLKWHWKGLDTESTTILGIDKALSDDLKTLRKLKAEGEAELLALIQQKVVTERETEIADRRAKLEKRLTAFEERLRDFNSKRTTLGYGGTYEPDVVSLREHAGITVAKSTTPKDGLTTKPSATLTQGVLYGANDRRWSVPDKNGRPSTPYIQFYSNGYLDVAVGAQGCGGRGYQITGNSVRFSCKGEGYSKGNSASFVGQWEDDEIKGTLVWNGRSQRVTFRLARLVENSWSF
ncbi:MAG: hypothetical protein KDA93_16315 [Planctomycetaceae bacterium]|nr:hypothetical protein [Planctomycetaceae bacterium]